MTLQDYLNLKNGTDVRGVASEGVEGEPITLTEEAVGNIVAAFSLWLSGKKLGQPVKVAIGYDSRISAPALCKAAVEGILSCGNNAVVTGLSTTPSMFMLLKDEKAEVKCDGSIMLTASHLPSHRNGIKFFTPEGGLDKKELEAILIAASTLPEWKGERGSAEEYSYLDRYAETLVQKVRAATEEEQPLLGKKIIVDAGNGAGGFFVDKVLIPLGANTEGSQFLEPDGTFPNHIPNPENKAAMDSICKAVKARGADFGIIFDTDVDRAGAVDHNGEEINRNRLIALISAILLEEKAGTIVTDSVTSEGLAKFIAQKGGRHRRFKRGYKNVINEAIRLNREGEYAPLAIETSGHAALMENYFLDDGAYLITRLLIALAKAAKEGKQLADLVADLEAPAESVEVRLPFVAGRDFKTLGQALLKDLFSHAETLPYAQLAPDNYEGCRISFDEKHGAGWALVRMSLHEPILPINVESDKPHGALKILKDLYYFLKNYDYIDPSPLKATIEERRKLLFKDVKKANDENRLDFLF